MHEAPKKKMSKLAVWSVILGVLSFVFWLLTAIPGLIFGIVAACKIGQPTSGLRGKAAAIVGIVFCSLGLLPVGPAITAALVTPVVSQAMKKRPLLEVRGDYQTQLVKEKKSKAKADVPPEGGPFEIVKYSTELGDMLAYLAVGERDKAVKAAPAIIWLTGGFPTSSPGDYLWDEDVNWRNDQSARVFRNEGITMMFPLVRGTVAENPGVQECFYGEVEDVLAALEYLKAMDGIDPERIYLGGHSTGGTLALLVAAATGDFAGVLSLGPTDDHYGKDNAPYEWIEKEIDLRAPINYLDAIRSPTYVVEGSSGNTASLEAMKLANQNPLVTFVEIEGGSHFNIIHPVNTLYAKSIHADEVMTAEDIAGCCD